MTIRFTQLCAWPALLALVFLSACSSTNQQSVSLDIEDLLHDEVFVSAHTYPIESPESLFILSEEAKAFVDRATIDGKSQERQVHGLVQHIFDRSNFDLLYSADANTDATTTFENRSANCLSFTIMTYAMARHARLNTHFQQIDIPEFWTRRSGYILLNGHVNLRIEPNYNMGSMNIFRRDLIIDFDPQQGSSAFGAKNLTKARIVAMFYNNKGAELILKGELNHAYAYFRAALNTDPKFEGALLNLGLVYRQAGEIAFAEAAYLAAIARNDEYLTAWENLAVLYQRTDRIDKANEIYARINEQRKSNPYYHMMLAEQALDDMQYAQSIRHFKDAIARNDKPHQFYFGLAQAHFELGNFDQTQRYLTLAKRKAGDARVSDRYGEKISVLASLQNRTNAQLSE
jgi:tetratricopeptide (TPR) repeat protein